jgi:adenylate cyclase
MTEVNGELIPQGGGDSIPLTRSPLIVGRRETCDICLQFPNVSGKHCELTFKDGFWILRDLNSTNGVMVNELRLDHGAKKVLHDGDVITIVKRSYKIQYTELGKASDLEDFEEEIEDVLNLPLLEKANLLHPPRHGSGRKGEGDKRRRGDSDD